MKIITRICLLLVGASLSATVLAADDPMLRAIKARQGEMQLRSFNVGPLFAMAKGKIDYDAAMAQTLANNLKLMLALNNGRAWAQGSDNVKYPGETRALPKIWETYPEIGKYGEKYTEAVNALAAEAGNGESALKSTLGALGKSCKGCHDEFREEK